MGTPVSYIRCCRDRCGHTERLYLAEVLQFLLPRVPSSLLMAVNDNKSPPLHWAILNNQVECTKLLAQLPEEQGGGLPMLEVSTYPSCLTTFS